MMNNLLFTAEEGNALTNAGSDERKRIELMTQTIGAFELINPSRPDHLMPRLQIMYRLLLKDPRSKHVLLKNVTASISSEIFEQLVANVLEQWLFLIFAFYGDFTQGRIQLTRTRSICK